MANFALSSIIDFRTSPVHEGFFVGNVPSESGHPMAYHILIKIVCFIGLVYILLLNLPISLKTILFHVVQNPHVA